MYIDAYLERTRNGEVLRVSERIAGHRILKDLPIVYEYYLESPSGTYKTIFGTYAERFEFNSNREMKKSLENIGNRRTFEAKFNPTFKTLSKYYETAGAPVLNKVFFDIEVDFHQKFGYAPVNDPFNRITAISLYQSWTGKAYVLCMAPEEMDKSTSSSIIKKINSEERDFDCDVVLYEDEKDMLLDFFDLIDDADVLSGWNSEFFDIPYMVNRTERLFNAAMTARFCLWNKKPSQREADNYGKPVIVYDLIGRVHLDYLALYKKHAGQVEQSYKLDYIGEKVTKERKVQYEGSLDSLYHNDFETFVRYSMQDSILLKKMDDKLDYINLHNNLAHQQCVLITTTMGSVALIDKSIINLAHERGEVVFDKKPVEESYYQNNDDEDDYGGDYNEEGSDDEVVSAKAAGAWVQDPVLGLVDEIGCTDFNSLYPTVLRTLGMSTECIIGQLRQTYTTDYLNKRIEEQRIKSKSKKFEPKWTEAWHGLFAAVEFTMVHEKSNQIITVDLEDGTTFESTGAELYDLIFAEDSTIVMSANGTLFDKTKNGVIPEILTRWYTERKQQQLMVIDYKHLYSDGLEIPEELYNFIGNISGTGELVRTNDHYQDSIYGIRVGINTSDAEKIKDIILQNGLTLTDAKIKCSESDVKYAKDRSAFWKQNQQIRKILLNSLYGALLNVGSVFFDARLGQSVTLTGRSMTKHMASTINEVCTGEYIHHGGAVVYGDTDSVYFSVAHYMKEQNLEYDLTRDETVELYKSIGDSVGETFPSFMDKMFNTGIERGKIVGADLEMVGSRGLFLKKKRYAILKYWEDGFRKDVDGSPGEIKAMGLEIKRSDTAKFIQDFLQKTLISLLCGCTEQELRAEVRKFKLEFKDKPSIHKGSPKTVKKLTLLTEIYNNTGACRVGHVNAAIQWNRLREIYDDKSVPEATDGSKVIVCDLKPNPLGITKVGFPIDCIDYLPKWFLDLPFDDEVMEKKVLTTKLENIFGIINMDIGINEVSNLVIDNDLVEW